MNPPKNNWLLEPEIRPKLTVLKEPVMRSVYSSNAEVLSAIITLHCPSGFDCDMTYGNGGFWKQIDRPKHCFDLTPLHEGVIQADSRKIPLPDSSLDSCVFDPPFMTYVRNGRGHKNGAVKLTARFGGYWTYSELERHYLGTITEARRILKLKGKLVFKCQDIVHNHRLHCTHALVIQMAVKSGFRLLDLFVLTANHRMPGPQKGKQQHARIFHSYFLVFERLK